MKILSHIRNWKIIIILVITVWLMYMFFPITPEAATRLAVLTHGYPIKAITAKLERKDFENDGIVFFILNPPYAEGTDTELFQWNVKREGIFFHSRFGVA